ncbi:MAG: glutathione S-transferase family protein [Proteobacteria bacterium]|nr:glutathione S-transferase family protein [Pseudomonadota bacterium]
MLTLHMSPGSSSMAVHIALHEVGVPFEVKAWSLAKKETRSAAYLAINPAGKVPALIVDGKLLTEVAGCLFYLAKRHPEANLLPANDPLTEGLAVSWMSFLASTVHPARAKGMEALTEAWELAEKKFGDGDWALGRYSVVDIHLFRLYWRMINTPGDRPTGLTRLDKLHDRMMARTAVKKTIEAETEIGYQLPA